MKLNYKNSGVDYDVLDMVKRAAQKEAFATRANLKVRRFADVEKSRGESAYVVEGPDCYFAFVTEGLGTKNLVADEMQKITQKTYYDKIAYDTVAAIINDLITVGAKPLSILAYWATGDSSWFAENKRTADLIDGWKKACDEAEISWGGGETPTLSGIVEPGRIDLAGAAWGIISPKERLVLCDKLTPGDAIICLESSGIHANGLTLARKLGYKLTDGFSTKLSNGKMYGGELLTPTIIYSKLVNDLLGTGIDIHYMVNITGHGWRKLMRAKKPFTYVINKVPPVPELFNFIQKYSKLSVKEMYATFNMGVGFAIIVRQQDADKVIKLTDKHKIKAWITGRVERGVKQVYITPKNIRYKTDDLIIR